MNLGVIFIHGPHIFRCNPAVLAEFGFPIRFDQIFPDFGQIWPRNSRCVEVPRAWQSLFFKHAGVSFIMRRAVRSARAGDDVATKLQAVAATTRSACVASHRRCTVQSHRCASWFFFPCRSGRLVCFRVRTQSPGRAVHCVKPCPCQGEWKLRCDRVSTWHTVSDLNGRSAGASGLREESRRHAVSRESATGVCRTDVDNLAKAP